MVDTYMVVLLLITLTLPPLTQSPPQPTSTDADDVPFSRMASPANSISAAADADDVPFSGTFLVFTICVVDALKVEGVTNRFLSFVNEEGETIDQEFGSVTIARGVQGDNPYATITENHSVILKQREMIRFLLRELRLSPSYHRPYHRRLPHEYPSGR
jgi:hypothetical protein